MPNNNSDNPEEQDVNARAFRALLHALCPDDPDEANRRYLRLHQKLAGFFRLKGMSDPNSDADDALDRAGEKILKGVPIPDIDRFCMGIARNIVMERLRHRRREESAFKQFIERSQNNQTPEDQITDLMKICFEKLPWKDRDVLIRYYNVPQGRARAEHRRQLAKRLNLTIAALRIRVMRLRGELDECVKLLSKNL